MKHIYTYTTRRSRTQKKRTSGKKFIKLFISINVLGALGFMMMSDPEPMVFVNEIQAEVVGELREASQAPADITAVREATGNPIVVEERDEQSIEAKIFEAFPEADRITAAAIAFAESHHNQEKASETDLMSDGRPFSVGLFQINLTWHKLAGTDCSKAFKGKNYDAVVIDETLYAKCVELAQDPMINIDTAKGIYQRSGNNFYQWTTYVKGHHVKFMSKFN